MAMGFTETRDWWPDPVSFDRADKIAAPDIRRRYRLVKEEI
jgi:hypothetical protein